MPFGKVWEVGAGGGLGWGVGRIRDREPEEDERRLKCVETFSSSWIGVGRSVELHSEICWIVDWVGLGEGSVCVGSLRRRVSWVFSIWLILSMISSARCLPGLKANWSPLAWIETVALK